MGRGFLIEAWSRGLCSPRTPGSRAIGPAPVLRRGRLHLHSSFRMLLEETEREPTGVMKTMKKGWQGKQTFPPAFFSFSPDAQHPAGGVPPPSPWPAVRAPNSQKYNLPLRMCVCVAPVVLPIRKDTIFICESMSACYAVPPENCLCDMNCCFRKKGPGAMPLVGCRGETPHGPRKPQLHFLLTSLSFPFIIRKHRQ